MAKLFKDGKTNEMYAKLDTLTTLIDGNQPKDLKEKYNTLYAEDAENNLMTSEDPIWNKWLRDTRRLLRMLLGQSSSPKKPKSSILVLMLGWRKSVSWHTTVVFIPTYRILLRDQLDETRGLRADVSYVA